MLLPALRKRLDELENLIRMALSRTGVTTPTVGTPNTQATTDPSELLVYSRTVGAGATTVDTRYTVLLGHQTRIAVDWSARDPTNGAAAYGSIQALVKNVGGVLTVFAAPRTIGADLGTAVATITAPGTTVEITATPPAGYADDLDWKFDVTLTDN
jgi:hypothetical protein